MEKVIFLRHFVDWEHQNQNFYVEQNSSKYNRIALALLKLQAFFKDLRSSFLGLAGQVLNTKAS